MELLWTWGGLTLRDIYGQAPVSVSVSGAEAGAQDKAEGMQEHAVDDADEG